MVVGLTGGIGSGKSTIARLFELLGCVIFNSDLAAKEIYFDKEIQPLIIKLLGKESYHSDSIINKKFISAAIFSDTQLLHALNAVIHPAVIMKFKNFVLQNPKKIIIKESALLFEANLTDGLDHIIVVAAKDELRVTRVMIRDGLTREEVMKKLDSQLDQKQKIKKADFILYNNEDTLLIPQVITVFNALNLKNNA